MCYREGLQARQCDVTGVLGARGSAHCALGSKPLLCPACHGCCVLLHRQGVGLPTLPADSLLPSCGHFKLVSFHSKERVDQYTTTSPCMMLVVTLKNSFSSNIIKYLGHVYNSYCRNCGPSSNCLHVFFRCMPPHPGMSMPETMEDILVLNLELSTLALSTCKVTFPNI